MTTTNFISGAFGKDVGEVFYPLQSGQTPAPNTGFITPSGDDLSALFMPISYGTGTSTHSGFLSGNNGGKDLSEIFSISANLSVSVSVADASCSYETTAGETCCNPGDIDFTITASGGSGGYKYSTTLISSEGGYVLNGASTATPYLSTTDCLPGTELYTSKIQVTVTDSNGNKVVVDASGKASVVANT